MHQQEFEEPFAIEMRRLCLNPYRLGGFAASGTDWKAPLLARMRALEPGASWEDVVPGIRLPEPRSTESEDRCGFRRGSRGVLDGAGAHSGIQ